MNDRLAFTSDPAELLALAEDYLAADPVLCSVVASMAQREASSGREAPPGSPHWYATVHDEAGTVVGVAMRTAPHPPHPLFVLPMPGAAATRLAQALHHRGEPVTEVNGALPTAHVLATETALLTGGEVQLAVPTRLYELHRLIEPPAVPGALSAATPVDLDLVLDWIGRFRGDADRQAGRTATHQPGPDRGLVAGRIEAGRYWLWRVAGSPVHLSGLNPPSFGAQRITFVYTPPEHRGHGWAGAAVADLCRQILATGARACLFTDRDNPVSHHLYAGLGFRPVTDMANLTVTSGVSSPPA